MYALYSLATAVLFVLVSPYFLWKGRATGKYLRTLRDRMGGAARRLPSADGSIWVHAVSVGEVLASRRLIERVKGRFPQAPLFVSTTTVTGQDVAGRTLGCVDGLFYAPFDWPCPVRRVLGRIRPRLLVLVETEIWPNLIHEAHRRGVRIAVVNGRISPRSFPRYLRLKRFLARVLAEVDLFLMQGAPHADRIRQIGAPPDRVVTTGNLKFDALPGGSVQGPLAEQIPSGPGPLWVAGSTAPGEEQAVLAAFGELRAAFPGVRLLLAPRHPERAPAVADLIAAAGLACVRKSQLVSPWSGEEVLLLDTLGELAAVYSLATVVFVGGSLVPAGGHNILEAALHGKAVVVGPHMENFHEIAQMFLSGDALVQVDSPVALAGAVARLLADDRRRGEIGARARDLTLEHRGALDRTVEALAALLALPAEPAAVPATAEPAEEEPQS